MLAIELASTEGFTRSAADVSLRRLVNYSLSPTLKAAFEQIYGPPFLARLLFAELGATADLDQFVRVDFDGAIHSNGNPTLKSRPGFGLVSATKRSEARMERHLANEHRANVALPEALAIRARHVGDWSSGAGVAGRAGCRCHPAHPGGDSRRASQGAGEGGL